MALFGLPPRVWVIIGLAFLAILVWRVARQRWIAWKRDLQDAWSTLRSRDP